jgi:hypothetical protein
MACVKKIEIVDGSETLFSLDGYEAEALDWYNNGGRLRSNWNYCLASGGGWQRFIGINFGRFLYDPEYAFDPKRYTNPQIRLTLDIDAGGNSPSGLYVTMWAVLFDEKRISPKGFLLAKELKTWTMADDTHEYIDLPTDLRYRGIYLRPFLAGTEPCQVVEKIKISEDYDKRVPYDLGAADLVRNVLANYPKVEEHFYFAIANTNRYIYCTPTERVAAFANPWDTTAAALNATLYDGDGGRLKTIGSLSEANAQVVVIGHVPHAVYQIPCGKQDDPADWWDVRGIGSLRADIEGAAAGTGYLFIQQEKPY